MKLTFATNNAHKLDEARAILGERVEIISLRELGCYDDIPETGTTLQANSLQKAAYIYNHFQVDCFADDTGLEIEALNGAPGVYTARYAGEPANDAANRAKVLQELQGVTNRNARFVTIITLILQGQTFTFEGEVKGTISFEERGTGGFGYDSIFIPEGYEDTFAVLPAAVKNSISHRSRAVEKLYEYLKTL